MKTLTLQKNRLVLAGLLAFAVMFITQITVLAYDYGGDWRAVKTVGGAGVQWLNVGSSLVDADINVGEMTSVTTGTPTSSGNTITLNGNLTNMGVAASTSTYFLWSQDGVSHTTSSQTKSAISAVSDTVTYNPQKNLTYRIVSVVGNVTVYGSEVSFDATLGNPIFRNLIPIAVAVAVGLLVLIASGTINIQALAIAGIGGSIAYYVTAAIIKLLF